MKSTHLSAALSAAIALCPLAASGTRVQLADLVPPPLILTYTGFFV